MSDEAPATRKEAAAYLRVHPVTLCRWKGEKRGPPCNLVEGRCLYPWPDLREFATRNKVVTKEDSCKEL